MVLWNMGEGAVKEKFKARGATARTDRCDLAMNYSELTSTTRKLKIVKSRYGTRETTLTLRFMGDLGFELVEPPAEADLSTVRVLRREIVEILREGQKSRGELIGVLGQEDLVDKALYGLVQAREVTRVKRGVYGLPAASEARDLEGPGVDAGSHGSVEDVIHGSGEDRKTNEEE